MEQGDLTVWHDLYVQKFYGGMTKKKLSVSFKPLALRWENGGYVRVVPLLRFYWLFTPSK